MTTRRRNLLDQILVTSDSCLCIVDSRRRMRFFSPGMESWTGWDAGQIEGLSCDSLAADQTTPADLLAAAFNPSSDAWKGHLQFWHAVLPTADGAVVKSAFCSVPLSNESGQIERILMVRWDGPGPVDDPADHTVGQQLHAEVAALRADFRSRYSWDSFIGADPSLAPVRQLADLLRNTDCHFNIAGEPGTGRRHLAKCIHVGGRDAELSLVPLHCDLLSTEALYDALRELNRMSEVHAGSHEHPGMLLLVDVERMPREVQQWLLDQTLPPDAVRLAATSSVPLSHVVDDGWMLPEFRQQIAPVEICLPPLHARGKDALMLAQEFVQQNRRLNGTSALELSQDVAAELLSYHWPGNIRELQQVIHQACTACSGDVIEPSDLPFAFRAGMDAQAIDPGTSQPSLSLEELLQSAERRILQATLNACRGNKAEAARRLGLTRPSVYRRLKTLGLTDEDTASEGE